MRIKARSDRLWWLVHTIVRALIAHKLSYAFVTMVLRTLRPFHNSEMDKLRAYL